MSTRFDFPTIRANSELFGRDFQVKLSELELFEENVMSYRMALQDADFRYISDAQKKYEPFVIMLPTGQELVLAHKAVADILSKSKMLNHVPFPVIITDINEISRNELRILGDKLYDNMNNQICVLGVRSKVKPPIMVVVSQDLVKKGISAHELANTIGDGKGGGKSHMAFTVARDINNLRMLLNHANTHIMSYIISKKL